MQIQLKQQHIEAALRDFVAKAGITFEVDEINFTAGRGKDGLTATVEMADPFSAMLDKVANTSPTKTKPAEEAKEPEAVEEKVEAPKEPPFDTDDEEMKETFAVPDEPAPKAEKKKAASLFS